MDETRRLAFTEHIPIRWGDMDAMGHVNNTVYFRYMEQTRISWFDTLLPRTAGRRAAGIVIANASCNFRRAMTYPGTVEIRLLVGPLGGSSVPTHYELRVDDDPLPFADGAAVVVFVDAQKQTPIRIPEAVRSHLEALA
jgi:acyl-CoA thioester hydrolase